MAEQKRPCNLLNACSVLAVAQTYVSGQNTKKVELEAPCLNLSDGADLIPRRASLSPV